MRKRGTVLLVAMVIAIGALGAGLVYVHDHEEEAREEAEPVTDAAADARVAKGKKKGGKTSSKARSGKPRGGTTRVSGRSAGGARPSGGAANVPPKATGAGGNDNIASDDVAADPLRPAGGGLRRTNAHGGGGPSGPSYESALAANDQKVNIGDNTGPDLTDAQIAAPIRDGSFVGDCGAPDDMGVTVKVAIRMGHAVGVSVYTDPSDADVAGCIERYVRRLSWPANPKTDSFVTTY